MGSWRFPTFCTDAPANCGQWHNNFDLHATGGSDAREAIGDEANEGAIVKADQGGCSNGGEQRAGASVLVSWRTGGDDLANEEIIGQHADRGDVRLDGGLFEPSA